MVRQVDSRRARQAAVTIVRVLRTAGHVAYLAGGCVRDEVLGLEPADYDVATDAPPQRVRTLFRRTAEVGAAFGVVLVTPTRDEEAQTQIREPPTQPPPAQNPGTGPSEPQAPAGGPGTTPRQDQPVSERAPASWSPATIEVATFRSEGPYSDRRRPDTVRFSDARSDALRRDFTVNALFLDPLPHVPPNADDAARESPPPALARVPRGVVIDYVGGLEDLRRRVLRAVGDPLQRFAEDHLRALRAVRIAARLNFEIEPATAQAAREQARELAGISRERIGEEIRRMLTHPARRRAVALLEAFELDGPVLNEPHTLSRNVFLDDDAGPPPPEPDWVYPRALAAWALDRGLQPHPGPIADLVSRWRVALCLSNQERDRLEAMLSHLSLMKRRWPTLSTAGQKRTVNEGQAAFWHALALLERADPTAAERIRSRVRELATRPPGLAPPPLLGGEDLIRLGLTPGPRFKVILEAVYDAQLEGQIATRDQALELARRLSV